MLFETTRRLAVSFLGKYPWAENSQISERFRGNGHSVAKMHLKSDSLLRVAFTVKKKMFLINAPFDVTDNEGFDGQMAPLLIK